jgi:nucleoside-diphosphate-sugar epimerase
MLNVLVTGGAGFVGSILIPTLLKKGYKVRVLDNLMYGGDSLIPSFKYDTFEVIIGDIRNRDDVKKALKGIDVIIHLAAIVGFPACKKLPDLAQTVNVDGTKLLTNMRSRSQLLIFASTGSNYGDLENVLCTEETKLNPITEYGLTKTKAEQYLMDHDNVVAYRFATAFGLSPRLRLDLLINDFVYQALKNKNLILYEKHFMRSFIEVRDMARSFHFVIENADKMINNVYNVGDESMNFSKEDIALAIKKKIDFYLHFAEIGEDLDKRNYYVSYEKINKSGFKTVISLEKGLNDLIRGLKIITIANKYSNV